MLNGKQLITVAEKTRCSMTLRDKQRVGKGLKAFIG